MDEDLKVAIKIINSRRRKGLPPILWKESKIYNPTFRGKEGQNLRDRRWELLRACGKPCVEVIIFIFNLCLES